MNSIPKPLLFLIWSAVFAAGDWLGEVLPPGAYHAVRWLLVLPLAVAGFMTPMFFFHCENVWTPPHEAFWPILCFPAFVAAGMYAAPQARWLAGALLLVATLICGAHVIAHSWNHGQTLNWISGALGITAACVAFGALIHHDHSRREIFG
jgi:hypothetical protein